MKSRIQKCVQRKEKIILRIAFIPRTQESVTEGLYRGSFTPLGIFNDRGRTQETEWRQPLNQADFRSMDFRAELTTSLNPSSRMRMNCLLPSHLSVGRSHRRWGPDWFTQPSQAVLPLTPSLRKRLLSPPQLGAAKRSLASQTARLKCTNAVTVPIRKKQH